MINNYPGKPVIIIDLSCDEPSYTTTKNQERGLRRKTRKMIGEIMKTRGGKTTGKSKKKRKVKKMIKKRIKRKKEKRK